MSVLVQADYLVVGAGAAVMAYAGICLTDDLQAHSDPYFSQRSQQEISTYTSSNQAAINEVQTVSLRHFSGGNEVQVVTFGPGYASTAAIQPLTVNINAAPSATSRGGAEEIGNTVTIATASAHTLQVGDVVTIAGVGVAGYNGTWTVTAVPTSRSFQYVNPTTGLATSGGGKTIDTAKIAADRAGIAVIIVPTIASTDAPCSGCAVLYSEEGVFERVLYQKMNPAAVLVDLGIIAAAPTRFLVAGMGDALSTWFESRSCDRTQSANECGGYSTLAGLSIAKLCYETLLSYGVAAKLASERQLITPALDHIVEANTLLSGLGFESSGLAAAHSIHNGLTALAETHAFYHGEKVAFGVLAGLQLADASADEVSTVYAFCEDVGLPTTLADVGLGNVDRRQLMEVAEKACAPGSPIYHETGVITPVKVLDAMLAADAVGQERRSHTGSH